VPTEEEIQKIIELYDNGNGLSQGQIAKEFKKSKSTIHEWLKGLGLLESNGSIERSATKKATDAKKNFDRERRLALNNLWFEKIETMLVNAKDANTLRALATPYGVASDKRAALEPNEGGKTGLEEMRESIRKERDVAASTSEQ
jgi:transposase